MRNKQPRILPYALAGLCALCAFALFLLATASTTVLVATTSHRARKAERILAQATCCCGAARGVCIWCILNDDYPKFALGSRF